MDPLSIASIVVKLAATFLSTAKALSAIRSDYKDAPISIVSICSEAAVISACLSRLQMIVCEKQDLVQTLESMTELNYALDVALTGCVVLFSCLDDEIRNITSDSSPTAAGAIRWKGKAKLVWNHEKLRDLLDGLRGQQVAIDLLIQLVQLSWLNYQRESIGDIKQVLGHKSHVLTESIRRTQSLKQSNPSKSFPASIYSMDDHQSDSANAPSISGGPGVNSEFEDLIFNSRVYRRFLASARAEPAEPDENIERSSVDFPDSQTIISVQMNNVIRDLKSWDISQHEQEYDTVSGSITSRPAIENNYLREREGQGNVKLEEAQISRKPLATALPRVLYANSANASGFSDEELSALNGPNTNKPPEKRPENRVPSAYGEIAILHKLDHPNIISLVEVRQFSTSIGLIISGVEYMHKGGIVHRNLHSKNLLLDDDFNIIISGFSQACIIDPAFDPEVKKTYFVYNPGFRHSVKGADLSLLNFGEKRRTGVNRNTCKSFAPVYTAPEMLPECVMDVPSQADVWSCGAILFEMHTGNLPFASSSELAYAFDDYDKNSSLHDLVTSNRPLLFPTYISLDAQNIISSILKFDPLVRADIEQIKGHRWMCDASELNKPLPRPPGWL
ncbi:camk camkl kin4 kinase protein [Rutstroemia sp. NJR-2017a BBW]|nr:camk camkl kin4 kinase protein [Rutstroemia sp. NJR-2017a BBW]